MGCTRMTEAKSGSADPLKQDKVWKKFSHAVVVAPATWK